MQPIVFMNTYQSYKRHFSIKLVKKAVMHSGNFNRYFSVYSNRCTQRTEDDRTVRKVLYAYDRAGRLVRKEVQLIRDHDGAVTVRASSITSYAYDRDSSLIQVELPEGGTIRYVYDSADRPVCRLEEGRKHGICRSRSCIIMGKRQRRCTAGSKRCMTIPESRRRADCLIRVRRAGTTCSQSTGMISGAA